MGWRFWRRDNRYNPPRDPVTGRFMPGNPPYSPGTYPGPVQGATQGAPQDLTALRDQLKNAIDLTDDLTRHVREKVKLEREMRESEREYQMDLLEDYYAMSEGESGGVEGFIVTLLQHPGIQALIQRWLGGMQPGGEPPTSLPSQVAHPGPAAGPAPSGDSDKLNQALASLANVPEQLWNKKAYEMGVKHFGIDPSLLKSVAKRIAKVA